MEARAPYHPAPTGPRNLALPLGEWLRAQGFTTQLQELPHYYVLTAQWLSSRGERFELTYTWQGGPVTPDATLQLRVYSAQPGLHTEVLFTAQRVRRLKEVRLLLTGNVRYHNARLLARPAAPLTAP